MRRQQGVWAVLFGLAFSATAIAAPATAFLPSTYTHDPMSGRRVVQYAPNAISVMPNDPTYRRSGYIHDRFAMRGIGGTVSRQHTVETWGEGENIRPYGEWQRPYRAGATPYGPWGNPAGPWTTPYGSYQNPFALGQFYRPWWSYPPNPGFAGGPGGGGPGGGPGGPGGGAGGGPGGGPGPGP